jgi:hypothetical protein
VYRQAVAFDTLVSGALYLVAVSNGGYARAVIPIDDTTPTNSSSYEAFLREDVASEAPLALDELLKYARSHPESFGTPDAYRILLKLIDPRDVEIAS